MFVPGQCFRPLHGSRCARRAHRVPFGCYAQREHCLGTGAGQLRSFYIARNRRIAMENDGLSGVVTRRTAEIAGCPSAGVRGKRCGFIGRGETCFHGGFYGHYTAFFRGNECCGIRDPARVALRWFLPGRDRLSRRRHYQGDRNGPRGSYKCALCQGLITGCSMRYTGGKPLSLLLVFLSSNLTTGLSCVGCGTLSTM